MPHMTPMGSLETVYVYYMQLDLLNIYLVWCKNCLPNSCRVKKKLNIHTSNIKFDEVTKIFPSVFRPTFDIFKCLWKHTCDEEEKQLDIGRITESLPAALNLILMCSGSYFFLFSPWSFYWCVIVYHIAIIIETLATANSSKTHLSQLDDVIGVVIYKCNLSLKWFHLSHRFAFM